MSLINDALKRAKEVQQNNPPPSDTGLHFRPADPAPHPTRGIGLMVPIILALIALMGLFFLWQLWQKDVAAKQQPTFPVAPTAEVSDPPAPAAVPIQPSTIPSTRPPAPVADLPPATISEPTNLPAAVVEPVIQPPLPKLQAVVAHPTRPSAIVNNKSVFIGDRVGEFRVRAITADTVTLVSATQTNVLTLEE